MDIEKLRMETPGVKNVVHFNNAGAALMPEQVFSAVTEYLNEEYQYGGYETAAKYNSQLEKFYQNTANLLNANPDEIAYLENATHAWDMAFYSIPLKPGDRILTSTIEYSSNFIAYLQIQKNKKVVVEVIPGTVTGEIDPDLLEKELKKGDVRLISITHIPTNGGIVNDAEIVGELAEKYGVLFLLDACQSAGQYPLDVKKLKCHFLSATGRKYLRGPRGTGFLYISNQIMDDIEPHTLDLHSAEWVGEDRYIVRKDARKFEKWESNLSAKHGLTIAIDYLQQLGIENIWDRVQLLAEILRNNLLQIPSVEVLDLGIIKSGIVTFRSDLLGANSIKSKLSERGINTSVAVLNHTLLDMQARSIDYSVRASVHYYNTEEEIDIFINSLNSILLKM